MLRLAIASLVALGLFAGFRTASDVGAATDFRQIVVGVIETQNRGDVAAMMAYYHEGAMSSGSASCDPPCNKAGIERDTRETIRDLKPTFRIVSIRETQTGMGTAKVEMRSDVLSRCGISRVVVNVSLLIVDEKIWREVVDFDRADVQTSRVIACFEMFAGGATLRPMPPRTGDGPQ